MARTAKGSESVNKSQIIREAKAANPKMKTGALAALLAEQHGLTVTPQFVSTVLSQAKRKKGISRGARAKADKSAKAVRVSSKSPSVTMDQLKIAKKLVTQLGGIDKAKAAVQMLAEILE